jgi:hypothetical protein
MKRQTVSLISLLGLLLMAGSAVAQSIHVSVSVPFNFAVGSKTLPAGTYDVSTIGGSDAQTLLLRAQDGSSSMMVRSNAAESLNAADKSKLVFNRYRDQYFLAEIWEAGGIRGHHLPKTSREKELAKELAQDVTRERVEVVATLD